MEAEARRRLTDLRGALERNPDEARAVLSTIFDGPIVARPIETPAGRRFQLEGSASVGGVLGARFSNSASPTGFENEHAARNAGGQASIETPDNAVAEPSVAPISATPGEVIASVIESSDPVEGALTDALSKAAAAGAWEAVQALTVELRARREARSGVVSLDAVRAKRSGKR